MISADKGLIAKNTDIKIVNNKGFIATVNQQGKLWLTSHKNRLFFKPNQAIQWLNQQFNNNYDGYCICCKQSSKRSIDLCQACENSLAKLEISCTQCAEALNTEASLCGNCIIKPPSFSQAQALWHYQFPLDQLIKAYKYQQKPAIGKALGQVYAQHLKQINATADLITYVPMHWQRRSQCDFNHSEQLAALISKQLNIALSKKLLSKIKANPKQHSLNKKQRQRNLKNSFVVNKPEQIAGKTIALVDDVMTTGSTAEVISQALIKAGAKEVHIWCLARVTKRQASTTEPAENNNLCHNKNSPTNS